MNVVDSSGWVEYFANEANAKFFTQAVQDLDNLLVPSICIYEVFKRLILDLGEENALQAVGIMSYGRVRNWIAKSQLMPHEFHLN